MDFNHFKLKGNLKIAIEKLNSSLRERAIYLHYKHQFVNAVCGNKVQLLYVL
jgi:hypothetical protein